MLSTNATTTNLTRSRMSVPPSSISLTNHTRIPERTISRLPQLNINTPTFSTMAPAPSMNTAINTPTFPTMAPGPSVNTATPFTTKRTMGGFTQRFEPVRVQSTPAAAIPPPAVKSNPVPSLSATSRFNDLPAQPCEQKQLKSSQCTVLPFDPPVAVRGLDDA